jgi:hypothetical protein
MTWIDIVLGGLLAYGLIKGLWKGLFVETGFPYIATGRNLYCGEIFTGYW